ncbi:MAG: hypothetical protein CML46_22110 [Rhodobacteraceae bacterium]|nr:hypothetical protein [Paracoccaceae bacterium]
MNSDTFAARALSARAALEREQRLSRMPVSANERDDLVARRTSPRLEMHLTPTGSIVQEVHQALDADNERRIGFITKRLEGQRGASRDNFRRTR